MRRSVEKFADQGDVGKTFVLQPGEPIREPGRPTHKGAPVPAGPLGRTDQLAALFLKGPQKLDAPFILPHRCEQSLIEPV